MMRLLLILMVLCTYCNSAIDRFYSSSDESDIDLLPLLKPYRLFSPMPRLSNWFLDFRNEVRSEAGYGISQIVVSEVNVAKGTIYGYTGDYFIIVPGDHVERVFKSKEEWRKFLKTKSIENDTLYDVDEAYNAFDADRKKLPWYNEVKNRK